MIDLAWHSSRLEGNRKNLLDTRALFERGRSPGDDEDALMLLNHKDAIEFVVDEVPHYGIRGFIVRNIQSLLVNGLETRRVVVNTGLDWLEAKPEWVGLKAVAMVESTREPTGRGRLQASVQRRYYLCSMKEPARIAQAIREHWSIESVFKVF